MVARSLMLGASMLSGASALLPLSGYLRQPPVPYSAASVDEVRKQNGMRMQDSGLELETDDSHDESPDFPDPPKFDPKTMPGVTAPLGFFDPLAFSAEASEGKVRFYRGFILAKRQGKPAKLHLRETPSKHGHSPQTNTCT